jgi:hypothetical protein
MLRGQAENLARGQQELQEEEGRRQREEQAEMEAAFLEMAAPGEQGAENPSAEKEKGADNSADKGSDKSGRAEQVWKQKRMQEAFALRRKTQSLELANGKLAEELEEARISAKVSRTPAWPRSRANFSLL